MYESFSNCLWDASRGVYEVRYLGKHEKKSAEGEDFAFSMHELQENIKKRLQESAEKYKQREDLKRREVNFSYWRFSDGLS